MNNSLKYGLPVIVSSICIALISVLITSNQATKSHVQTAQLFVEQQLSSLQSLTEQTLEKYALELMQVIEAEMVSAEATDAIQQSAFNTLVLASLKDKKIESIEWARFTNAQSQKQIIEQKLAALTYSFSSPDDILVQTLSLSSNENYQFVAVQLRVKTKDTDTQRLAIGIFSQDVFKRVFQNSTAEQANVFLIDSDKNCLASSDQRFVNSKLNALPQFAALFDGSNNNQVIARAENNIINTMGMVSVANANIHLLYSRSTPSLPILTAAKLFQIAFAVIGVCIFALGLARFLNKKSEASEPITEAVRTDSANAPARAELPALTTIEKSRIEREVFSRTLEAIASSIRQPIYALIGKLQLLRTECEEFTSLTNLEFIETQARAIRATIDEIDVHDEGVPLAESVRADISDSAMICLASVAPELHKKNIEIQHQFIPSLSVAIKKQQLDFIFSSLMQYLTQLKSTVSKIEFRTNTLAGVHRFEAIVHGQALDRAAIKKLVSINTPENLNITIARLIATGQGGRFDIIADETKTTYRIDLPRATSSVGIFEFGKNKKNTIEFDTAELDDVTSEAQDTSEISTEIKNSGFTSTREINPDSEIEDITNPIRQEKISEDTEKIKRQSLQFEKVRTPRVRIDI